jgi:glycosyltransferase involved in cell wall biosynthesis
VVPAWNEEASIASTIQDIRAALADIDILVVNDGSADQTGSLARATGATVLDLSYNLGVGGAMRAGFRYALAHGYDSVVQIDGDGQHDPRDVPALLTKLAEADVVIGTRFDANPEDYPVHGPRKWAMALLATVISRLAHTRLTDTTSGFRATGPRALPLYARYYPAEYLGDTVESLVIAIRAGCRIAQVPVTIRLRRHGQPSHSPRKATVYLFRAMLALLLALVRRWKVSVDAPGLAVVDR